MMPFSTVLLSVFCFGLLAAFSAWAIALQEDSTLLEWQEFKAKHGKSYPNFEEDKLRLQRFLESKVEVEKHNEAAARGKHTFFKGINQFSDLFEDELKSRLGCVKLGRDHHQAHLVQHQEFVVPENFTAPKSVDWRSKGAVTSVKYQGECGSCWAFSAVGALEGQHFLKTGKLVDLSVENLVECVYSQSRTKFIGCEGGIMGDAYDYIKQNGGIDTEASYPYVGYKLHNVNYCHYNSSNRGATDKGYVRIPIGDEVALEAAVATVGPISVGIRLNDEIYKYKSGIMTDPFNQCVIEEVYAHHAVLVVGYGADEATGLHYWIVKDSYGSDFGEDGYFRVVKGWNWCAIANNATYPLV